MADFLGVSRSATGRRWVGLSEASDRQAQVIAQQTGLPATLSRTLARLGVLPEAATAFLAPSLRDLMPDPSIFRDMDTAAARIKQAISARQRIAIFADYDVDGGSSAALLIDFLRQMGLTATLYGPTGSTKATAPTNPPCPSWQPPTT